MADTISSQEQLVALLNVPGALKFVAPYSAPLAALHEQYGDTQVFDPQQTHLEDIISIEPHSFKEHLLVARTAEGSSIQAEPEVMLQKLTEWRG